MSPAVFVDTSAWYALMVKQDEFHGQAAQFAKKSPRMVTTNYVLLETLALLTNRHGFEMGHHFAERLKKSSVASCHILTPHEHEKTLNHFLENGHKGFSLTDCSSFIVMQSLELKDAFAFDKHFQEAGFRLVPTFAK